MPLSKLASYVARLYLLVLLAVGVWPQQRSTNGIPIGDTPEQVLKSRHIAIRKPSLVAALLSDDAEVRKLAAGVLANRWPKDAAPAIEEAMLREADDWNRIWMAFDLAKLGDKAGREMLGTECHNTGEWGSTRMLAARKMSELHDDSCVDSVLDVLGSDSDPQDTNAKESALDLVPSFIKHFTGQEYRKVLDLAEKALDDPAGGVRIAASIMLGRLGDVSAVPGLQAALAREQDETVQGVVSRDVKRLEELHQGAKQ